MRYLKQLQFIFNAILWCNKFIYPSPSNKILHKLKKEGKRAKLEHHKYLIIGSLK